MYNIYYMNTKPGHQMKKQLRKSLDDLFDTSITTLNQRRQSKHKLQIDIERELETANPSLLKKLYIVIQSHNYQKKKHDKYYYNY